MRTKVRTRVGVAVGAAAIIGLAGGCVYNTPSPGTGSAFNDVATISKTNAWAVGTTFTNTNFTAARALIEHFDGHSWTLVTPPSTAGASLSSVAAVSATDVWAVGSGHTLHWDGHTWSVTTDPAGLLVGKVASGRGGALMALALNTSTSTFEVLARSANNWQPIATPTPPLPTSGRSCDAVLGLDSLTFLTANDVWVGGVTRNSGNAITSECPYVAHWNGSAWTTYAPPDATHSAQSTITAISERIDGTVWAVGQGYQAQSGRVSYPGFAARWNGSAWQGLCNFGCSSIAFTDIDATGTSVWATGISTAQPGASTPNFMLISRWVGNGWAAQPTQEIPSGPPHDFLTRVSVRGGSVTSGGYFVAAGRLNPLIDVRSDG